MTNTLDHLPTDLNRQRVISAAEAAAFLNLSLPHFRRLYRNGGVPAPIRLSTRRLGFRLSELIDWVEARQGVPLVKAKAGAA